MSEEIKVIQFANADNKTSSYFKKRLSQNGHNTFFYNKKTTQPSIRLNDDHYKKPEKTITELMQTQEVIAEKLSNYEEIENKDLELIPKNSLLSYITFDPERSMELYRTGGYLRKVAKDYIVLAGKGGKTFSVQKYIYNNKDKNQLLYVTRFFGKKKGEKSKRTIMNGGANDDEESIRTQVKSEYEESLKKSSSFMKKQQEILEIKSKEIAELKARLAELDKHKVKNPGNEALKAIHKKEAQKIDLHKDDDKSVISNKSVTSQKSNISTNSSKNK
jgi:hypothetical protein